MEPQIRKRCYKNYIHDITCNINKAHWCQAKCQTSVAALAALSLPEESHRSLVRATTRQLLLQRNTSELIPSDLAWAQTQADLSVLTWSPKNQPSYH